MMFCAVRKELLFLFRNETWDVFTAGVCNWQDSSCFGLSLTLFFCLGILNVMFKLNCSVAVATEQRLWLTGHLFCAGRWHWRS